MFIIKNKRVSAFLYLFISIVLLPIVYIIFSITVWPAMALVRLMRGRRFKSPNDYMFGAFGWGVNWILIRNGIKHASWYLVTGKDMA